MIFCAIVHSMRGPQFLEAVLASKALTPNALAVAIQRPGSQGTISRYISGKVSEPKQSWTVPAARYLGFDHLALSDERTAAREAERMGLMGTVVTRLEERRPRVQARIDPGMLILQISEVMRGHSQSIRDVAAPLFSSAALCSPEDAAKLADAARAILRVEAPRSGTAG